MQDYQPYSTTAAASQLWPQNYRPPAQHTELNERGQYVSEWFPSPSLPNSIQYLNFAQMYNAQGYGTIRRARELYRRLYERNATLSRTVMIFQLDGVLQPGSSSSAMTTYYLASAVPVNLTQKPRNWRRDYRSPSSKVGGLRRHLDKLRLLFTRRVFDHTLNSLISYRTFRSTSVIYDLRFPFGQDPTLQYANWNHSMSPRLATSPPVQSLVIWHPKLPWRIKIQAANAGIGVTLRDVFNGIYEQLRHPIGHHEYYTVELTSEDRDMLTAVFEERCAGDSREVVGGLRRVDFLGRDAYFVGLLKGRDGKWEMKTSGNGRRRIVLD